MLMTKEVCNAFPIFMAILAAVQKYLLMSAM